MQSALEPVIRLGSDDNVVVARTRIVAGTQIGPENLTLTMDVPAGHKVATRLIKAGEPVLKENVVIGFAAIDKAPGTHVTSTDIRFDKPVMRDYAFASRASRSRKCRSTSGRRFRASCGRTAR